MTDPMTPIPTPDEPSLGERFVDVFTAPVKAMDAVAVRPAWVVPALVVFALMFVYTAVNMHIIMPAQTEMQLEHATDAQAAALETQLEMFTDPPVWLRVLVGLGAGLGVVLLGALVFGLVLHLFLKLSEGQGTVKHTLGIVYWSGLIAYGLKTLLSWIVVVLTGSMQMATLSAASLIPDPNPQSLSYVLAGLFGDPFVYWMLAVAVIGVSRVHLIPVVRAAVVVVATYVLLSAIPVGFTLLGQMVSG